MFLLFYVYSCTVLQILFNIVLLNKIRKTFRVLTHNQRYKLPFFALLKCRRYVYNTELFIESITVLNI